MSDTLEKSHHYQFPLSRETEKKIMKILDLGKRLTFSLSEYLYRVMMLLKHSDPFFFFKKELMNLYSFCAREDDKTSQGCRVKIKARLNTLP